MIARPQQHNSHSNPRCNSSARACCTESSRRVESFSLRDAKFAQLSLYQCETRIPLTETTRGPNTAGVSIRAARFNAPGRRNLNSSLSFSPRDHSQQAAHQALANRKTEGTQHA